MATRYFNRVEETSTTTGTGDITLSGPKTQYVSFSSRYTAGNTNDEFCYCIAGQAGSEWEVGQGYLVSSTILRRTQVHESSNSDQLVSFSSGIKDVFVTIPAQFLNNDNSLDIAFNQIGFI
jgi:hypothetical protein